MSEPCSVRLSDRRDVATVLAIWARADAVPSATDDVESVLAVVRGRPGSVLLAEVDWNIVGTLIVTFDGWRGNMYRLAVLPEFRRRGIASHLVAAGESRLRDMGAKRISALVVGAHAHACEFWSAVGYDVDDRITRFVKTDGGDVGGDQPSGSMTA